MRQSPAGPMLLTDWSASSVNSAAFGDLPETGIGVVRDHARNLVGLSGRAMFVELALSLEEAESGRR